MSTNTILIIAILIFAPVFGVLLYNTYQEKKYRDSIRAQFGHADKDALMESHTHSVRDGQQQAPAAEAEAAPRLQPAFVKFSRSSEPAGETPVAETPAAADSASAEPVLQAEPAAEAPAFNFQPVPAAAPSQTQEPAKRKLLLDLQDLAKQQ
ncbi:MAG: cell division protein ZipA, partial [Eikenella corrodens]